MTFTIGDRVKYIGNFSPALNGMMGTVAGPTAYGGTLVNWDDPDARPAGVITSNLARIDTPKRETFKVGDRVTYVGLHPDYNQPWRIGQAGTVVEITDPAMCINVRWDVDPNLTPGHYSQNIAKAADKPGTALREQAKRLDEKATAARSEATRKNADADKLTADAAALRRAAGILDNDN